MDKKNLKKTKKILLILMISIAVLILILLYFNATSSDGFNSLFDKPEKITIEDRCSLVMGQLFHEIKNEDECRIKCKSNCEVRGKNFAESEFIKNNNSCHTCNCYCK